MYQATAIQKQFWIAHQQRPDCPAHNIPSVFRVQGSLNLAAWKQSLNNIVANHEIFRSQFLCAHNGLFMVVNPCLELDVQIHTCGADQWEDLVQDEISHPFDLNDGPLIRAKVFRIGPEDWVLTITLHHIIFDLRTKDLFGTELTANYEALALGKPLPDNQATIQYREYCIWQAEFQAGDNAEAMDVFWEKQLAGYSGVLDLPHDYPRPLVQSLLGDAVPFNLSLELTKELKDFSRGLGTSLYLTMLTAYFLVLFRYAGQKDLIVGVPFTSRRLQSHKDIMGCFMNILPIGVNIESGTTFRQLLDQIRSLMLAAHRNQEAALETIVRRVGVPRDPSRNPLFQIGFTYEHPMEIGLHGLSVESVRVHPGGSQLDMFAVLDDTPGGIAGHLEYRTSLFSQNTVEMFADNLKMCLQAAMDAPDVSVDSLDILAPAIREKIEDKWNDTAHDFGKPTNLKTLFEDQVAKTPDNVAVIFKEEQLTYSELNARTNQLARHLQNCGVGPGVPVGVFMERSVEMVEAIYGIVKAGGAYVPLDPNYPQARLEKILEEARPAVVLTTSGLASAAAAFSVESFSLDGARKELSPYPTANLDDCPSSDSPVYIIFTSGSTGNPKGVVNAHEGVSNRILWMQKEFNLEDSERVLQKTPFSFDVSVWEFFWPLVVGASLVVAPPGSHRDPGELERIISEQKITTLHFVPSMLQAFLDTAGFKDCKYLKRVISSGEALSVGLMERFHEATAARLTNLYGPTEAAVDVTCWHCGRANSFDVVPIGKPIANTKIFILDRNFKSVPPGACGEIFIGGIQVAVGYINQPEMTKKSFLPDPFENKPGATLYRTGDLGRYLSDGNIEYLGRLDSQVKIRGFRIELGEIESSLADHPLVSAAAVQVQDQGGGDLRLFAYAAPGQGSDFLSGHESLWELPESRQSELANEVLESLKMLLPDYMVPSKLMWLQEIPLGSSGKIDRKSLPEMEMAPLGVKASFASPKSQMEQDLAVLWAEVLKIELVGRDDSFFDLGGNSLLSIYLANKMQEKLNREISVVLLFQYPTIKLLARFLELGEEKEDLLVKASDRAMRRRLARGARRRDGSR